MSEKGLYNSDPLTNSVGTLDKTDQKKKKQNKTKNIWENIVNSKKRLFNRPMRSANPQSFSILLVTFYKINK